MENIAGGIPGGIIRKYFGKNNPGSIAKRILENKIKLGNFLEESNQEFVEESLGKFLEESHPVFPEKS